MIDSLPGIVLVSVPVVLRSRSKVGIIPEGQKPTRRRKTQEGVAPPSDGNNLHSDPLVPVGVAPAPAPAAAAAAASPPQQQLQKMIPVVSPLGKFLLSPDPERPVFTAAVIVVVCSTNLTEAGAGIVADHLRTVFSSVPGFLRHNLQWSPGMLIGVGQYETAESAVRSITFGDEYVAHLNPWGVDLRQCGAVFILSICTS